MLLVQNKGATASKKERERMPSTQEFWDSAVRGGPVSRAIEPFHRLLRLVQLGPDLLAITIRYRVVPRLNVPPDPGHRMPGLRSRPR
jgi:hypothetical protein